MTTTWPNLQRMARTGARGRTWLGTMRLSRGASFPSGVEPARTLPRRPAPCLLLLAPLLVRNDLHRNGRIPAPPARPSATSQRANDGGQPPACPASSAGRRAKAGGFLARGPSARRQVRRVAAGFNHALQRTAPGVTACAPAASLRSPPATFPHRLRRPPQSLSLRSLGGIAHSYENLRSNSRDSRDGVVGGCCRVQTDSLRRQSA